MKPTSDPNTPSQSVVASFSAPGRHYEARLNDCGKVNCSKCGGAGRRTPSHGPYWYLCVQSRGQWRRIYLGKELDTARFITSNGRVDWDAIKAARKKKNATAIAADPPKGEIPQ